MIKIAIDNSPLKTGHGVRGVGVNTRELINSLKNTAGKDFSVSPENINEIDASKFDIIHLTHFNPFFISVPFKKLRAKTLLTIHDLIPLRYPGEYPPGLRGKFRFFLQKIFLKHIDAFLTISETSKKDIQKYLNIDPKKIYVVLLAAKKIFKKVGDEKKLDIVGKKYKLPSEFVLYVGDVNYNKNILTLIKACKEIEIPLVIVGKKAKEIEGMGMELMDIKGPKDWFRFLLGKPHPELAHYKKIVDEFDSGEIIRTGFVSDEDLVALYNLATCYVQPSFCEGFGLSVLEAQACGTPVVASRIGAHKEVAGEGCLYFNPRSTDSLVKMLKKVIGQGQSTRLDLSKKGLRNAKKFSWEKTAKEVLDVYSKLSKDICKDN